MNDAIYLRQGDELVEMTETPYEYERILQEKLAEYPRLLAGGQMSDQGIDKWTLIAREASVPDKKGGGERWSADHLFVDQDAVPTIIEVKRSDNREIRRNIVGQMFDYVSHASIYWDAATLEDRFHETCEALDVSPDEILTELVGEDAAPDFWDDVQRNLRSKKIRLVFVADEVPSELKRVVEFLNEAMQDVEVLAIEVLQYSSDEGTVFVPRLYGQTEEAKASSSSSSRTGSEYVETETEIYEDLDKKLASGEITQEIYDTFVDLYDFAKESGDGLDIGGTKNAKFGMRVTAHHEGYSSRPNVFTANVNGEVKIWPAQMPLNDENPEDTPISWDPEAYDELKSSFQSLEGVPNDENSAPFEVLTTGENLDEFKRIITDFVQHCRQSTDTDL